MVRLNEDRLVICRPYAIDDKHLLILFKMKQSRLLFAWLLQSNLHRFCAGFVTHDTAHLCEPNNSGKSTLNFFLDNKSPLPGLSDKVPFLFEFVQSLSYGYSANIIIAAEFPLCW